MLSNMFSAASDWAVRQQERSMQASQGCCALAAQSKVWAGESWTWSATRIGRYTSSCLELAQKRDVRFALYSAAGVNAQLVAASCILPTLPIVTHLTTSAWLSVTLGAAALGYCTTDYPLAAAGIQLGAQLGAIGAIAVGRPTCVVAATLTGMAVGAGGPLSYFLVLVARPGAAHSQRIAKPGEMLQLIKIQLKGWGNAAGLSDTYKSASQHVARRIFSSQPLALPGRANPIVGKGDLKLSDFAALTQLPDELSVGGDFFLDGCTSLTHLPDGLHVYGGLDLRGCTGLTQLADDLIVDGYLNLSGCTALAQLPGNLRASGYLDFSRCTALTHLPAGLRVNGDFCLAGCTGLTQLPDGLRVAGSLDLSGCTGLVRLPAGLRVGGDLRLSGCTGVTHLPAGFYIDGNLYLDGCTGVVHLPARLSVGRDFDLSGCTGVTHLPARLSVGRDFDLCDCTSVTCLPARLNVGRDFDLSGCFGVTCLPTGLSVGGSLDLSGCTGVTHLPEGLSVGSWLDLSGCTGLAHLPTGLSVGGWLELSGCTSLTHLSAGLHIGEILTTFECTRLAHLPEDMRLGQGQAMLRTLHRAQQRLGGCAVQDLAFSEAADASLLRLPDNQRYDVLRIMQQLAPALYSAECFETVLAVLVEVSVLERAALPELCAPLMQAVGPVGGTFVNMFTDVCLTPVAQRPARVQALLAELWGMAAERVYTNVHEGARDIQARAAVRNLWCNAGVQARAQGAAHTFATVDAFVQTMQRTPSSLTDYLKVAVDAGQTHLDRARLTLQSLRAHPAVFTLDIASRHEEPLDEIVAMLYNLGAAVQEGSAEQTEAKRLELQRLCVAALSDSLCSEDGATHCAQGVVQRLLTPLQGYYPEVRLDAFEPPTEGDFVCEFGRDLRQILAQAAPGTDCKALARKEASAAFARAEVVYAPLPDAAGGVSHAARQAAAARIAKVRSDINDYLEHDELV